MDNIDDSSPCIGIDLGTTNTCVSIWRNGGCEIIPDEYGNKTIPSFVAYTNKARYIGHDAKKQQFLNPKNVFYEVKRFIGRKMDDKFVEREREFLTYDIVGGSDGEVLLKPVLKGDKLLTPEEISAAVLTKAKQIAADYLGRKVTDCVITVPAHFNDGQRQATKDASEIAGLRCIRIINEPTAAALAYGLLERTSNSKCNARTILVYDFGGGTLDVSLLTIENGIFDVIGSTGNMKLGGADFDKCLMDFCLKKFGYQNKEFVIEELDVLSLRGLRASCEQAKHLLSTVTETHIAVRGFWGEKDLFFKITRKQFEDLCGGCFLACLKPVDDILKQSSLGVEEIDEIILVGGMTRVPKIRELLKIRFKKDPNCTINPDEAVAAGAAIQGYLLTHADDPFSEAVTLLDSTALSLGVETVGGVMNTIVKRGEIIPTSGKKTYTTDADYVDSVKVRVYEGERTLTKDNFLVGEFELMGIAPQPRGLPEIEVTFEIDANGIITVTALNKKTNDRASMLVTSNKGRLSQRDIVRLVEEARELEVRDEFDKRKKWLHYEIDEMCSNIVINMGNGVKLGERDRKVIEEDIAKIIRWLKEKPYDEREDDEYESVLAGIKAKYTIFVVRGDNCGDVKSMNAAKGTTAVHDEDDGEGDEVFDRLEEAEMGFKGLSDAEKEELKEYRKMVRGVCYDISDMVASSDFSISEEHKQELRDCVEDTLLWLHSHDGITKQEYIDKIGELNAGCDVIAEYYRKGGAFRQGDGAKGKMESLENLCLMLRVAFGDGAFPVKDEYLEEIKKDVDETLGWIYGDEDGEEKCERECGRRMEVINEMYTKLCGVIQGLNICADTDVFGAGNRRKDVIVLDVVEGGGTSLLDILQKNKANVIERMIINDD